MPSNYKIVGIYDGDGTILGEIRYFFAKYFLGKKCSLCDITHGDSFRGKTAWRNNFDEIEWLHRNDQTEEMRTFTENHLPVVIRQSKNHFEILLSSDELTECKGDYEIFLALLREKLQE